MSYEDINDYERTIERLTILFSKGEISEESYKKAIKTIEEKLKKLPRECPQCGKKFSKDLKLCPYCGWQSTSSYRPHVKKPTNWWYLVPLLFGLLGGIIAYVGVKNEDEDMAVVLFLEGIIVTFLVVGVIFAFYQSIGLL